MRMEILRSRTGSGVPKRRFQPTLNPVESRLLLSTLTVTTTVDNGPARCARPSTRPTMLAAPTPSTSTSPARAPR